MSKRTKKPEVTLALDVLGHRSPEVTMPRWSHGFLELLGWLGIVQDFLAEVDDDQVEYSGEAQNSNRVLETANDIEKKLRVLLKSHGDLLEALEHLIPFAQSRIEDMGENAAGAAPHHKKEARRLYRLASDRFGRALVKVSQAKALRGGK